MHPADLILSAVVASPSCVFLMFSLPSLKWPFILKINFLVEERQTCKHKSEGISLLICRRLLNYRAREREREKLSASMDVVCTSDACFSPDSRRRKANKALAVLAYVSLPFPSWLPSSPLALPLSGPLWPSDCNCIRADGDRDEEDVCDSMFLPLKAARIEQERGRRRLAAGDRMSASKRGKRDGNRGHRQQPGNSGNRLSRGYHCLRSLCGRGSPPVTLFKQLPLRTSERVSQPSLSWPAPALTHACLPLSLSLSLASSSHLASWRLHFAL